MSDFTVKDIRISIFQKGEGAVPHQHDYYQLYHIISGNGLMRFGKSVMELKPHQVILISPGVEHGVCEILGETPLRFLDVIFLLQDSEIADLLQRMANINSVSPDLLEILWKVKTEWNGSNMLRRKMVNGLFQQYFIEYMRMSQNKSEPCGQKVLPFPLNSDELSGVPRMIVDYVQTHYSAGVSLQPMAESLGYSKNYLCRAFKKATNMTIVNYMNHFRIGKALELIRFTDKTLIEISDMVGFNDFHYFSRVFKSVTGSSPGELRNKEKFAIYLENQGSRQTVYRYYNNNNKTQKCNGGKSYD